MSRVIANPLFGLAVCLMAFSAGQWASRRLKTPLANPLFLAIAATALFLLATGIPYDEFYRGGSVLTLFLAPATASLAIPVYRRRAILRRALLPVLAGCLAGSVVSMLTVWGLCRLLNVDAAVMASLLPKSVTTPIAIGLAAEIGGLITLATAAVIVTGMTGAVCAPLLIRWLGLRNPVLAGIAIGTCSHAIGTARAAEMGEIQGAISGISIGITGLATTMLFVLL